VHILFEVVRSTVGVSGGLVARGNGGFVVHCVCWRHTTMSDAWDMGLFFGGGHEHSDALYCAVWRAVSMVGVSCKRC
jgi:hypothetical protein